MVACGHWISNRNSIDTLCIRGKTVAVSHYRINAIYRSDNDISICGICFRRTNKQFAAFSIRADLDRIGVVFNLYLYPAQEVGIPLVLN